MYNVLICDDQPDIVNALKIYLTPEGYNLFEAFTGAQAGEIAQKTEDIVGPYELNDFYLHHFLLERRDPEALFSLARGAFGDKYSPAELLARMKSLFSRFFAAQFKRSCLSDGPQILDVSISPRGGLELSSDASAALWMDETERLIIDYK